MNWPRGTLLFAAVVASCAPDDLSRSRDGLVTLPGATLIANRDPSQGDDHGIKYELHGVDATGAVKHVCDSLKRLGWRALAATWHDGQTNSYTDGWFCHPGNEQRPVYVWAGDWVNGNGDVVTYSFTATGVGSQADVVVSAVLVGESQVRFVKHASPEANLSLSEHCRSYLREREAR